MRGRGVEPLRLAAAEPKADLGEATAVDPQDSAGSASGSEGGEEGRAGSPPRPAAASEISLDVLRQKLDAAIVAEAWDAVKAIRERMTEVERAGAGNVVKLDTRRRS